MKTKRNWPAEQARADYWLKECYRILLERPSQYTQLSLRLPAGWNGRERRMRRPA